MHYFLQFIVLFGGLMPVTVNQYEIYFFPDYFLMKTFLKI